MAAFYAYTPDIWPPLAAAVFLAALSLYSWRRRGVPGALLVAVGAFFGALWLLGIAFEAAAVAPAAKIAWYKLQAVSALIAMTAMTCFALEYAYPGRWLTLRNVTLLSLAPLLTLLLIVSTHSQFAWHGLQIGPDGSVVSNYTTPGRMMVAYAFALGLVNTTAFLWLFVRSPQHRWPAALMVFGQIAGRGLYLLGSTSAVSVAWFDPEIAAIFLTSTMYAIALFGFHIFDPVPAARKTTMQQMREGMAVFDAHWRVATLNPAAVGILGASAAHPSGKTLAELLPAFPDLSEQLVDEEASPILRAPTEINLGTGTQARYYALDVTPLKDFRGPVIGHLLLLHDVTEKRRAQERILAEQWAQATLQEREQLAHELHDGLSQSLAFLNLQAQAAQVYLQTGQHEAARANLARLAEVSREMQGDVREVIGRLLAISHPTEGFCSALRQALARFEQQTGLATTLEIDDDANVVCDPNFLSPAVGVQLLPIVQEALVNVRKHAGNPSQISVRLQVEGGCVQLAIEDNGVGFDPVLPGATGNHFGLQVMRQRAARIGGQVAILSAPGHGTRVEVRVPLNPVDHRD